MVMHPLTLAGNGGLNTLWYEPLQMTPATAQRPAPFDKESRESYECCPIPMPPKHTIATRLPRQTPLQTQRLMSCVWRTARATRRATLAPVTLQRSTHAKPTEHPAGQPAIVLDPDPNCMVLISSSKALPSDEALLLEVQVGAAVVHIACIILKLLLSLCLEPALLLRLLVGRNGQANCIVMSSVLDGPRSVQSNRTHAMLHAIHALCVGCRVQYGNHA